MSWRPDAVSVAKRSTAKRGGGSISSIAYRAIEFVTTSPAGREAQPSRCGDADVVA